jgi:hypothetical protein
MEGDVDMMCVTNSAVTSPHTYHMKANCIQFLSDWKLYYASVIWHDTWKKNKDNWQIQTPINPKYNMNSKILKPSLLGSRYNQQYNTSSLNTAV